MTSGGVYEEISQLRQEDTKIEVDTIGLALSDTKTISSNGLYKYFDVDFPAETKLKIRVSGTATWSRLWVCVNQNSTPRVKDFIENGEEYDITLSVATTSIEIYMYTISTSGTVELDVVSDNKLNKIKEDVEQLQSDLTNLDEDVEFERSVTGTGDSKVSQIGSWNNGSYNMDEGALDDNTLVQHTIIQASAGDYIKLKPQNGIPNRYAAVCITNQQGTEFEPVLVFPPSGYNEYEYIVLQDCYLLLTKRGESEVIWNNVKSYKQLSEACENLFEDITEVSENLSELTEPSSNLFNINEPTGQEGKYKGYISGSGSNRVYIANNGYNLSPYIEVEEGATYVGQLNGSQTKLRFVYFYTDKGLSYMIDSQTVSSQVWSVTVNSGYNIKYARFCIATTASDEWNPTIMIQKGTEITPFEHYGTFIKNLALHKPYLESVARIEATNVRNYNLSGALRDSISSLAINTNFSLSSLWVHNFLVTSARIKGVISNVLVGVGYNIRYGGWIELTQTQTIVHFYYNSDVTVQTENHGLTLGEDTMVSIFSNEAVANKVHVVILSNGSQYEFDVTYDWNLGGTPFVRNANSLGTLDVELSATPQKITKQVWLFGDSYTYPYVDRTWTKWLWQWNGNKDPWLASQQPGGASAGMYNTLLSLISTGSIPKFIVWALGMNDGSDTDEDTPNTNWLTYANNLDNLCKNNNITPIFVTIPNVPTINHEGKNKWIKNSGYRYIDLAMAVGATTYVSGVRNWYGAGTDYDYLAADGIHATAFGGRAMASQVLQDFPEIICDN